MNKIDLIIEALELARNEIHDPTLWTDKVDSALDAAYELRDDKIDMIIEALERIDRGHYPPTSAITAALNAACELKDDLYAKEMEQPAPKQLGTMSITVLRLNESKHD